MLLGQTFAHRSKRKREHGDRAPEVGRAQRAQVSRGTATSFLTLSAKGPSHKTQFAGRQANPPERQAHHISPGFSENITSWSSRTAFVKPSSMEASASSCSIDIT